MHPFNSILLIPDPRVQGRCAYPMDYLLLCLFLATLSGKNSWHGVADYTEYHLEGLRRIYGKIHGTECLLGVPSHDTFNHAISALNPHAFEWVYREFLQALPPSLKPSHLCLDGKAMRGVKKRDFEVASHCVSATAPSMKAAVAQVFISSKTSEISAMRDLLEVVELEGAVVTIDAIGAQVAIAQRILDGGGDYIFCIKGNQPATQAEIGGLFAQIPAEEREAIERVEAGHGRVETRRLETIVSPAARDHCPAIARWPGVRAVHAMRRERTCKRTGQTSEEIAYYLSSIAENARVFALIREHWTVENELHYLLDTVMQEDGLSQAGEERGAEHEHRLQNQSCPSAAPQGEGIPALREACARAASHNAA